MQESAKASSLAKCQIGVDMPPKVDRNLKCGSRTLVVANSGGKLTKAQDHYIRNVAKLIELFTTPYQAMTILEFDPLLFTVMPEVFNENEFIIVLDKPTNIACIGRRTSIYDIESLESFCHVDGYVKTSGDDPTYSPRYTGIVVFKVTYIYGDSLVLGGIHFHHLTAKSWYTKMPAVHAGTSFKESYRHILDKLARLVIQFEMQVLLGDFNQSLTRISNELQKRGVSALLRAFAPRLKDDLPDADPPVISMTNLMNAESGNFDCLAAFSLVECTVRSFD